MIQPISIEKTARTVEEALRAALDELQVEQNDVEVQVIEEASKGFLGFIGGRPARVLVTVKPDAVRDAVRFLRDVFQRMDVTAEIQTEWRDKNLLIQFVGDDLGILIGRRGDTLDALQYLTNLVVNRALDGHVRIVLDVENYRQRREETLVRLAKRLADKAKRTGTRVVLEPMSPQERRIIHTTLQEDDRISTHSEGEDPFRKVVIIPKNPARRMRSNDSDAMKTNLKSDRGATRTGGRKSFSDEKIKTTGDHQWANRSSDRHDGRPDQTEIDGNQKEEKESTRQFGNYGNLRPGANKRDYRMPRPFSGNTKISRGATPLSTVAAKESDKEEPQDND
ncbi:RNA-binding cell elongation regulator Jag/EloR [Heliophilum fasciatum]|uniref:RNA-binding protein KhpB n=1 Tax=Heliophilum fasciatum TaxID=35700 RepID=A0A4R2RJ97_9FIRM|nr:RNA-binding cell elongation regulator Jag/EloR [Heliophilum fasciatum]MCW2278278.1 putative RNA-binding protein Jag [Heliophilum fasciatum]TCP63902.1 putative RNA-binding protein Jag [Heliophilum fasciatum]